MHSNLALARLRHARRQLAGTGLLWKALTGQIDRFAGLLTHSGLVHALLAMRRDCEPVARGVNQSEERQKKSAATAIAATLVNWLATDLSPVKTQWAAMIVNGIGSDGDGQIRSIEVAIGGLMETEEDGFGFMAIQREAHRYAAAMKLVGKAFAG